MPPRRFSWAYGLASASAKWIVAAEMLGGTSGIGYAVLEEGNIDNAPGVFALLVIFAALGIGSAVAIRALETTPLPLGRDRAGTAARKSTDNRTDLEEANRMTEAQIFAQPQVFQDSGDLTPEMLAEAEAMIGQELRIEQYCHEACATLSGITPTESAMHNPLWCDEEYATTTGPHGTIVAPPTFLYAVFQPGVAPGLPGIQTFNAGGEWVWNRLPRLGERLKATAKMTGLRQIRGSQANELYLQTGRTEYRTTSGELVASCDSAHFRAPRRGRRAGSPTSPGPSASTPGRNSSG